MVKKYCPKCKNYSYSARTEGEWVCPTCGCNITDGKVLSLEESDQDGENSN